MKHTLGLIAFGTLVAMSQTACLAPGTDSPIRVGAAHRIKPAANSAAVCDVDTSIAVIAGFRDVSTLPLTGSGYFIEFDVDNNTEQQGIVTAVNNNTIAGSDRNDYLATEAVLTYTSFPRQTFSQENVPVHMVVKAGTSGNKVLMDIIGPKASQALTTFAPPGTKDGDFTLYVTMKFNGHLASGEALTSNTITYPITIVNSGFDPSACPAGTAPALSGPCGEIGGQDGVPFCCGGTVACPQ